MKTCISSNQSHLMRRCKPAIEDICTYVIITHMLKRYIGDQQFYKTVFAVAIPIVIQNAVTSFVSLLDNIMVGQVGTLPMSGVSVTNNLLNVYNLTIFGAVAAVSIFGAQYAGRRDNEGMRYCLRLKLIISSIVTALFILLFLFCGSSLIHLYMDGSVNTAEQIAETAGYAENYMLIMLVGLVPFGISQAYGATIRETGQTKLPMVSSIVAVIVNFCFNLVLIFGYLGFPKLGIAGAAIATVISRFAELGVLVFGVSRSRDYFVFFQDVFKNFTIPAHLIKEVIKRGTPLVMNELLWSIGMAAIAQCYSTRGLNGVAAYNIANTVQSIFFTVCIGMGMAISILVGQKLGAGRNEEAVIMDRQIIFLAFVLCVGLGFILFFSSPLFPLLYNTSDAVRDLAVSLLKIQAVFFPIVAVYNCTYFTLRCGGRTIITFLFDSVSTCLVSLPLAFVLSRFTGFDLPMVFMLVQCADILKVAVGLFLVNRKVWVHNLVVPEAA